MIGRVALFLTLDTKSHDPPSRGHKVWVYDLGPTQFRVWGLRVLGFGSSGVPAIIFGFPSY